ncbi:MAG: hypothetical protein JST32_07935, partial [Bacteroidetes bacterium]|nr:hypothetical protein [Bacteroidota bacterium]
MRASRILTGTEIMIIVLLGFLMSCSGHDTIGPTAPMTDAQILVQAGEWFTRGGTLTKDDGTTLVLAGN